jgi:DNA-binding MarR family transcriptional regulator
MTAKPNPAADLKGLFHEPARLAILSSLCKSPHGLTFNELKESCQLTDGNLSRHLRVLEGDKIVKIKKNFVDAKPRTTVFLTASGRGDFVTYLKSLEDVLKEAALSLTAAERRAKSLHLKPAIQ